MLQHAAAVVERLQGRRAAYSDVKGYLAEADLAAHDAMMNAIQAQWPDDDILSEESTTALARTPRLGSKIWIVDPICGTTNYVRGIPFYSHAVSVLDADGVLAAGIYHPALQELFLADRDVTTLNGQPVEVSKTEQLSEAVVAVNCNQSDVQVGENSLADLQKRLAPPRTRRLRILESANLELAYVACGRLDGYVNPQDKVWDVAAGSLMIASAGGRVATLQGSIHDLQAYRGVVASNAALFDSLHAVTRNIL